MTVLCSIRAKCLGLSILSPLTTQVLYLQLNNWMSLWLRSVKWRWLLSRVLKILVQPVIQSEDLPHIENTKWMLVVLKKQDSLWSCLDLKRIVLKIKTYRELATVLNQYSLQFSESALTMKGNVFLVLFSLNVYFVMTLFKL